MNCPSIHLTKADIYLIDAYNASSVSTIGYGQSYGTSYGSGNAGNITSFDFGKSLGCADVKITAGISQVNAVTGRNIDSPRLRSRIESLSLNIISECWSNQNIALFLDSNIIQKASETKTENIYINLGQGNAIIKNGTLANVNIYNNNSNLNLTLGVDYIVRNNRIEFLRDIIVKPSFLDISYNIGAFYEIVPYVSNKRGNYKALAIVGENSQDGKMVYLKFPKVLFDLAPLEISPFSDDFFNINVVANCYAGTLEGMKEPAPIIMYKDI